jgi:hypothetical protein
MNKDPEILTRGSNKTPRIAILLCGYLRTWDKCLPSFLKFMGDINYDVFIHTYTTIKGYHPYISNICNISDNNIQQSGEDIIRQIQIPYKKLVIESPSDSMNEIQCVEEKDLTCYQWPDYNEYDDLQVLKGKGISIRTYLQYRKLRLCNDLCKEYEKSMDIHYDFVIKLRMDLDYSLVPTSLSSLLKKLTKGKILTSASNCQPNDHIYVCFPEDMDKLIQGFETVKIPINREYNPHEYLRISLDTCGLTYDPCIHNLGILRI